MSQGSRGRAARRRQRSVRVTVAVGLLVAATFVVVSALWSVGVPALSAASVLALGAGWASARILCVEVAQERRDRAGDRARQAREFTIQATERSAQHASFARAMGERLAGCEREVRELEGTLRLCEERAAYAEHRAVRDGRQLNEARRRVRELEVALEIKTAEDADELACWDASLTDTVVDLLSWEERGPTGRDALDERKWA